MTHTPGPWSSPFGLSEFIYPQPVGSLRVCIVNDEHPQFTENSKLIALAPTAPHDCDLPSCPGAENKRKLEAAEKLYAVLSDLEWEGDGNECPSCGEPQPLHWKDCALCEAIEAYERGL